MYTIWYLPPQAGGFDQVIGHNLSNSECSGFFMYVSLVILMHDYVSMLIHSAPKERESEAP